MKSTSITYRIFAITMALLIFITSVGFSVDMHYCQGQLKTFNLFGKAKSCHDIGEGMKDCPQHKQIAEVGLQHGSMISNKGCCSNKLHHFQSDQDQQYKVDKTITLTPTLECFTIAFVASFLSVTVTATDNPIYAHYKPPNISRDIYVLLETFLL